MKDDERNILNFTQELFFADQPFLPLDPDVEVGSKPTDMWETLREAIERQVKKDGVNKDYVLEGELDEEVLANAVAQIYYDVADFYEWWFNPEDDRAFFVNSQPQSSIPSYIHDAVKPTVEDNLDAMREVGEIPAGVDVEGLDEVITNSLSRYIVNWNDWYWEQKKEEDIDAYFEQKSFFDNIYIEDDYGNLSNLDAGDFDGVTDVPYLSKEIGY